VREAVDLQTEFAKTSFDKFVSESTKLSEQTVKNRERGARADQRALHRTAVEKLWKPLAA
jgi:hypothetical protein